MKKPDEFNEFIKRQLEENPQEPPQEAWHNISDSLDLEGAWQGIEQDLELDNLWEGIDARLATAERLLWWNRVGNSLTGVMLLLVLSLPLVTFLHEQDSTAAPLSGVELDPTLSGAAQAGSSAPGAQDNFLAGEESHRKNETIEANARTAGSAQSTATSASPLSNGNTSGIANAAGASAANLLHHAPGVAPRAEESAEGEPSSMGAESTGLPEMQPENYLPQRQQSVVSFGPAVAGELQEGAVGQFADSARIASATEPVNTKTAAAVIEKKMPPVSPWRIGVGAAAKMSWLMNQKTLNAMDKSSLTTSLPSFRKSFSLQAEKGIRPRLSLLGELALYSETGQRYEEYQGGMYGTTDTELRYSHLTALLAYRKQPQGQVNQAHTRLLLGLSTGWLHSATLTGPLGVSNVSAEYKRSSLGMVLGYEYMHPLGRQWWLGYGLRSYVDLLNIYNGNEHASAESQRTRSTSLDFTINLKYEIRNK